MTIATMNTNDTVDTVATDVSFMDSAIAERQKSDTDSPIPSGLASRPISLETIEEVVVSGVTDMKIGAAAGRKKRWSIKRLGHKFERTWTRVRKMQMQNGVAH